jgi:hypothetical protein
LSLPKIILVSAAGLFTVIGVTAFFKKTPQSATPKVAVTATRPESQMIQEAKPSSPVAASRPVVVQEIPQNPKKVEVAPPVAVKPAEVAPPVAKAPVEPAKAPAASSKQQAAAPAAPPVALKGQEDFPNVDRIQQLFAVGPNKLPIVETIGYTSSVSWLKGRPAWVADYASYYQTSRHFIARSLNGKPDYFSQKVSPGSKFNVFRKDKRINFHLLIDMTRFKMGFYYVDLDTNERVLLKTYKVGLGRLDPKSPSGSLTPLGKYSLGNKIAIYKPGTMGYYQDQKAEMIRVFGTRWIPFDQELEGATAASKGYGIHGAPWTPDAKGQLAESRDGLGKYDSDGCIRLAMEDIEELFSIIITKPTFVEIVKDFREAKLPGIEVAAPTR